MRLEHENLEGLKHRVLAIISRHLDLRKHQVFFFGSRVTGKGDECSDIDIGILGPKELPLGVLAAIREEIEELPILYKIDVVDFSSVSEGFKEVALQEIELIQQ